MNMVYEIDDTKRLYLWEGLHWETDYDSFQQEYAIPLCPKQRCNCKIKRSKEPYSKGEYKYNCIRCDFKITLNKQIEEKAKDFVDILESLNYKDAEIINIDGELISVQKEELKDKDYWIEAKLSKNKKGQVQLMVLAGSKKQKDKTQLFLDPTTERLTFDQNNDHPRKVFAKVVAEFKNSKLEIVEK